MQIQKKKKKYIRQSAYQKITSLWTLQMHLLLLVVREPVDAGDDEAEWKRDVDDEMEELEEERADSYAKSMHDYNHALQLFKEQRLRKVH